MHPSSSTNDPRSWPARRPGGALALLALIAAIAGCDKPAVKPPPPKPVEVEFALPMRRSVSEFAEFTGRTWSAESVEIRARVSGYLDAVEFDDGAEVEAGQLLFTIDDRAYVAEKAKAEAELDRARTQKQEHERRYARSLKLIETDSITRDEIEAFASQLAQSKSAVAAAQAALELADLRLSFTRVRAPFSGKIGRKLVDEGNLVKENETHLATVVSLDPIHAYFDLDERTVRRMRKQIVGVVSSQGTPKPDLVFMKPVELGLSGEQGYPLAGRIDWVDNQLDVGTGTLRVRAEVANADRQLSPGMFVRARIAVAPPESLLLIPEQALGSNQGLRFVYLVGEEEAIEERRVEIGWQEGSLRVIRAGLQEGDRVVVTGLQRVRSKMKVQAKPWNAAPLNNAETAADGK